jgi:hypothetical protein
MPKPESLYDIPPGCICYGDGLLGMECTATEHARLRVPEKNPAAVELGKRGGAAMAKRGPEYFKRISAMRKNKRGGRPKKNAVQVGQV